MPQDIDQSDFADLFKAEADDYLAKLQQGLLSLEKNPDQPPVVEEVFRAAHTLKGSARMMGYRDIEQIAHHLESLFDRIKTGKLRLTSSITDQGLAAIDAMSRAVASAASGQPSTVDIAAIMQALERCGGDVAASVPDATASAGKAAETATTTSTSEMVARTPEQKPVGPIASDLAASQQPPSPAQPQPPKTAPVRAEEFIRIPVSRIDSLFNLAGELFVHKVKSSDKLAKLRQLLRQVKSSHKRAAELLEAHSLDTGGQSEQTRLLQEHTRDAAELKRQVIELTEMLSTETLHLDPVIDELQYKVRTLRMLPCATIFDGLERLVRDTSHELRKEVQLAIEGAETELDKKMLEAIKPCLVHLLRNAVDHGIEPPDQRIARGKPRQGTVRLCASHQGGKAVIEIHDDGGGVNTARVREVALQRKIVTQEQLARMDELEVMELIFSPGFSTASIITDVSGRGVGADVVKKEIEALKGHVRLDSRLGEGTTVTLELPLTVAIIEVLLVETGGQRFGLPLLAVDEIVRVDPAAVRTIENRMAITWRERTVPVVRLDEVLNLSAAAAGRSRSTGAAPAVWPVVIVAWADRRLGLLVDGVLSDQEVFIKGLPANVGTLKQIAGAAIVGTGEVILILDVQGLVVSARGVRRFAAPSAAVPEAAPAAEKPQRRILVVEDSLTTREFERSLLEANGYEVETAVDGLDALDKVGRATFDLVVADVEMPRMNGFEFCQALRQREAFKQLPVVIVTTRDKEEDKRRGLEVGAQAYIVKSAFNQNHLLETIERLVG